MDPQDKSEAVSVEIARKVRIANETGRTVYELENRDGQVSIKKVTTSSSNRATVKLADLKAAVRALDG